jgi:hypothetical protein
MSLSGVGLFVFCQGQFVYLQSPGLCEGLKAAVVGFLNLGRKAAARQLLTR